MPFQYIHFSIFDHDIVEERKFTFISTINLSGNLNNLYYSTHVGNNFSGALCHYIDAAVISDKYSKRITSKGVLENNTFYTLLYKVV